VEHKDPECVLRQLMESQWGKQEMKKNIEEIELHPPRREAELKYKLNPDESFWITAYTQETERPLYNELNSQLLLGYVSKDWHPFLDCFLRGLCKLDDFKGRVFRVISKYVKDRYTGTKRKFWPHFASTSTNIMSAIRFIKEDKENTLFVIEVTGESKDIASISMFPKEKEVLLLPNFHFVPHYPKEVITETLPGHVTVIYLKQIPTPVEFSTMRILAYKKLDLITKRMLTPGKRGCVKQAGKEYVLGRKNDMINYQILSNTHGADDAEKNFNIIEAKKDKIYYDRHLQYFTASRRTRSAFITKFSFCSPLP